MTPEEVFARLRDIHMPETTGPLPTGLDPRPLLVFAMLVALLFASRWWRRRRRAAARLSAIDPTLSPAGQRDALVRIARDGHRGTEPPPPGVFASPSGLSGDDIRQIRTWVRRRLGC